MIPPIDDVPRKRSTPTTDRHREIQRDGVQERMVVGEPTRVTSWARNPTRVAPLLQLTQAPLLQLGFPTLPCQLALAPVMKGIDRVVVARMRGSHEVLCVAGKLQEVWRFVVFVHHP